MTFGVGTNTTDSCMGEPRGWRGGEGRGEAGECKSMDERDQMVRSEITAEEREGGRDVSGKRIRLYFDTQISRGNQHGIQGLLRG